MPNPKLETYKNKATGTVYDYTDAAAQAALADILDGADIGSFSDVETALATKVDKVEGKGLSTNDYDNTAKAVVTTAQDNIIANTKLIKDTVGWSGKNKWDKSKTTGIDATITQTSDGFRAQVSNHTWGSARCDFPTPAKNKDFILTCKANVATAGNFMKMQVYGSTDGSDYSNSIAVTDTYSATKKLELAFNSGNYNYLRITLYLTNGTATSADVTFEEPMLCDADILDDTYEPYFGSTAFPRSEQAVLGAVNLNKYPYRIDTITRGTLTYTALDNGVVKVTGSASAVTDEFPCHPRVNNQPSFMYLPKGTYYFSISASDGSDNFQIEAGTTYNNAYSVFGVGYKDHEYVLTIDDNTQSDIKLSDGSVLVSTYIRNKAAISQLPADGVLLYPQIALAPNQPFAPYAMTNKELTENKLDKESVILASTDDLDNIFENGLYSWQNSPVHAPTSSWGKMIVQADANTTPTQFVYQIDKIFIRRYGGSPASWSSWYAFTGTVVS